MPIDNRAVATRRMDALDHGIVLAHGPEDFDKFGARDVWVFRDEDGYYMHYDAAGDVGWLAALATSPDGINWTKQGTVLELGGEDDPDSESASYATTYYDGNQWHMFYMGTPNTSPAPDNIPAFPYRTLKAKSNTPTGPWIKQRDVIPLNTVDDTYYSVTATPGNIIKHDNEHLQIFSSATYVGDSIKRTLGIASTNDLNAAWKISEAPILPLEEQIENVALYYEDAADLWFLFTNHVAIEQLANGQIVEYTDALWVYWSDDLFKWNPENKAIVLDRQNCTWSPTIIGLPSALKIGDCLALYYDGNREAGYGHMQRDIGLAWLELPLHPPPS